MKHLIKKDDSTFLFDEDNAVEVCSTVRRPNNHVTGVETLYKTQGGDSVLVSPVGTTNDHVKFRAKILMPMEALTWLVDLNAAEAAEKHYRPFIGVI